MMPFKFLFFWFVFITTLSASITHGHNKHNKRWVKINVTYTDWEDMKVYTTGERKIFCGNIEKNYHGKYHWRFNETSVLPVGTQIHKHQLVFLKGAEVRRDQFVGTYDCCVRESLGNACYISTIRLREYPQQLGVDLTNSSDIYVPAIGDSILARLVPNRRVEGVSCKRNNKTSPENVLYPYQTRTEGGKPAYYQVKFDHFSTENEGEYNCTIRLRKNIVVLKTFRAKIGSNPLLKHSSPLFHTFITSLILVLSLLLL